MSPVYIARSKQVAARMLGGEMMIMSALDSTLFSLNETASAIWQAADGSTPLTEIVERVVCAEFDVAPEEALADAQDLVRDLAVTRHPASVRSTDFDGDQMSLMQEMGARALKLGVPLSVQMDVTYRCNERCVHCYLDHDDHGEMTTAEIKDVLGSAGRGRRILSDLQRRRSVHAHGFLRAGGVCPFADVLREVEDQRIHDRRRGSGPSRCRAPRFGAGQHLLA